MYAVTSTWLVSLTRATLRSAEFGFFGVVVYTRVHTPRRCGLPFSAAVFTLAILLRRPLRTSCLIGGMYRSSVLLLRWFWLTAVTRCSSSLCTAVFARSRTPRPGVSHASEHRT